MIIPSLGGPGRGQSDPSGPRNPHHHRSPAQMAHHGALSSAEPPGSDPALLQGAPVHDPAIQLVGVPQLVGGRRQQLMLRQALEQARIVGPLGQVRMGWPAQYRVLDDELDVDQTADAVFDMKISASLRSGCLASCGACCALIVEQPVRITRDTAHGGGSRQSGPSPAGRRRPRGHAPPGLVFPGQASLRW